MARPQLLLPMMMQKTPDWRLHFDAFLASRLRAPFVWGVNDCAIFAADAVLAMTGQDPAPAGLRGHRTARQATRSLHRHGELQGIATAALGEPVLTADPAEGDVVLVRTGKRQALAIANGQGGAFGPAAAGLAVAPLSGPVLCWRVW